MFKIVLIVADNDLSWCKTTAVHKSTTMEFMVWAFRCASWLGEGIHWLRFVLSEKRGKSWFIFCKPWFGKSVSTVQKRSKIWFSQYKSVQVGSRSIVFGLMASKDAVLYRISPVNKYYFYRTKLRYWTVFHAVHYMVFKNCLRCTKQCRKDAMFLVQNLVCDRVMWTYNSFREPSLLIYGLLSGTVDWSVNTFTMIYNMYSHTCDQIY